MTAIRFFTDEDVDGATARALRAAGLTRINALAGRSQTRRGRTMTIGMEK